MDRRKFLIGSGLTFAGALVGCKTSRKQARSSVSNDGTNIKIYADGVEENFKIIFASDTHIALTETLPEPYGDYASRMYKYGVRNVGALEKIIAKAQSQNFSAIILAGDIINYPSEKNISAVAETIKKSKVPVFYTAGNHDWHYEGDSGSDIQQRQRWLKALAPLYLGEKNPLIYSQTINGFKFIMLDNSTYDVLPEQVEAFKREISDGKPCVVCSHIPYYFVGRHISFGCGNPNWGAKSDPHWKIERRERWRDSGLLESTFQLHNIIMNSPNVLGCLAGHTHKFTTDIAHGKFQYVAPKGILGDSLVVEVKKFSR